MQAVLVPDMDMDYPDRMDHNASSDDTEEDPITELSEKHSDMVTEVLLRMLDWMGVHKNTWSSAAGVWDMLLSIVPAPEDYPVFSNVKSVLVAYMNGRVKVIPICVNNCMAFYNCQSAGFSAPEWQTEDDDFCTLCGEDRWLRASRHGLTGTNRKVRLSTHTLQHVLSQHSDDIGCYARMSQPDVRCRSCTTCP